MWSELGIQHLQYIIEEGEVDAAQKALTYLESKLDPRQHSSVYASLANKTWNTRIGGAIMSLLQKYGVLSVEALSAIIDRTRREKICLLACDYLAEFPEANVPEKILHTLAYDKRHAIAEKARAMILNRSAPSHKMLADLATHLPEPWNVRMMQRLAKDEPAGVGHLLSVVLHAPETVAYSAAMRLLAWPKTPPQTLRTLIFRLPREEIWVCALSALEARPKSEVLETLMQIAESAHRTTRVPGIRAVDMLIKMNQLSEYHRFHIANYAKDSAIRTRAKNSLEPTRTSRRVTLWEFVAAKLQPKK